MTAPLSFEAALALSPGEGGRQLLSLHASWTQGRTAFGGLLAAAGLRAIARAVPPDRAPRSMQVGFVGPAAPGPVEVEVRTLSSGRNVTWAEARLTQEGRTCAVVLAAFGAARPSRIALPATAPPPAPTPLELPELPYLEGLTPTFTQHFDFRFTSDRLPFTGSSEARLGGWIRLRRPAPPDAALLVALVDAWPAPVLALLDAPAPASSVAWQVNLPAPVPADLAADAFFRCETEALAAQDGYADVVSRLWAADGTLVAVSRQLVAEFSGRAG